jgi:hypothetical protein
MVEKPKSTNGAENPQDEEHTDVDRSVEGRREMLHLLKKAAVAAPVLMTLKSSPARASTASATS